MPWFKTLNNYILRLHGSQSVALGFGTDSAGKEIVIGKETALAQDSLFTNGSGSSYGKGSIVFLTAGGSASLTLTVSGKRRLSLQPVSRSVHQVRAHRARQLRRQNHQAYRRLFRQALQYHQALLPVRVLNECHHLYQQTRTSTLFVRWLASGMRLTLERSLTT